MQLVACIKLGKKNIIQFPRKLRGLDLWNSNSGFVKSETAC
jgi:hypothetical protein